ncbi:MAG: hypothetical protein F6J93_18410 [Oscillatoria sp. SIO1A7]|nr:hypothetical protein [Oscillatoria sp. SIO1A7]
MDQDSNFQPGEIVCLEHEGICLYAEVIQILVGRPMFWVRPLMLAVWPSDSPQTFPELPAQLYDLRQGSDLVWPMNRFRPALDIEVIPLLTELETATNKPPDALVIARRQLRDFVQQVWEAYPDAL